MERVERQASRGPVPRDPARAHRRAARARRGARREAGRGARLLRLYALSDSVKEKLWASVDTAYFLRHDAQEIAWHTRNLHYRVDTDKPVVKARLAPFGEGLQVMVYTRDREALFARICGYFERAGFSIAEAKVHTTRTGYALDTFVVMGEGRDAHYQDRIAMIETDLAAEVQSDAPLGPPRGGRLSRRVRHFPISPRVDIRPDERGAYHVLSIVAADRPGPALRRRAHPRAQPHQPADRAHQHAGRPRRGRVPRLGRVAGRLEDGAAARAGPARGGCRSSLARLLRAVGGELGAALAGDLVERLLPVGAPRRSASTIDSAITRLRYHLASAGTTVQGACGAAVFEIASS